MSSDVIKLIFTKMVVYLVDCCAVRNAGAVYDPVHPSHSHVHVLMCTVQSDVAMKVPHFINYDFCTVFFI